ncbi:MAG: PKD domain-containing protein [Rhodanobacteraceae bacterium]|nr:PKD domain-containing protein [Rhodanobacteraceae bacterium]
MKEMIWRWRRLGFLASLVWLPAAASTATVSGSEDRGESWQIEQRQLWFENTRGLKAYPEAARERAAAIETQRAQRRGSDAMQMANGESWESIGPSSMLMAGWDMANVSGRINAVTPVPENENIVYVGSASGGVWKTTDGGANWTPVFEQTGTQPIGAVTLDPSNSNTVWVGAGDKNGGACAGYFGQGVFLSEDAGATWSARNGSGATAMPLSVVNAIAVQPTDGNVILAGGSGNCSAAGALSGAGVFRSADRGLTWTRVLSNNVEDIVFVPGSNTVYAGLVGTGVFKSTDGGTTWTNISGIMLVTGSRMRLAMAPSDSNTLYALIGQRLYRTTDAGGSWTQVNAASCEGQCSYNLALAVSPTDPSTVLLGAIRHHRSTNGGTSFTALTSQWGTMQSVHQDTHVVRYSATNPQRFWVGTDGGLWRTDNGGLSYANLNTQLSLTQFYDIAVHPDDADIVFGGSQDNSSMGRRTSLQWGMTFGSGDGFMNAVDPTNPARVFQTGYPSGGLPEIVRSNVYGSPDSFEVIPTTGLTPSNSFPWVTPMAVADNQLFIASNTVYRTATNGTSWTAVSPNLGSAAAVITPLRIGVLMPTYVGTSAGAIYFSPDASVPSPTFSNVTGNYPGGRVSDAAMDPANAQRVFVTRSGFGASRLYRSTTGGTTWTPVGTGLPNVPANSVVLDPLNTNRVFVGTDVGVYESLDGGDNFAPYAAGMPLGAVVTDLEIDDMPHVLTAGTYGRGAWRSVLSSTAGNLRPTADIAAAVNDLTVAFTSTSTDRDGTLASYLWDFGDGSVTSTLAAPSHTYVSYGNKTVTLTVTDDDGATATYSRIVNVRAPPAPLQNGVTMPGLSAGLNEELRFTLAVPAGATNLSFATTGAAGAYAQLTVALNGRVVCEGASYTANESCTVPNPPPAGTYLVLLFAYTPLSNQTMVGRYTAPDLIFTSGFQP